MKTSAAKPVLFLAGLIVLSVSLHAWQDYQWRDHLIDRNRDILAGAEVTGSTFTRPWTWLRKPVTQIWMVKLDEIYPVTSTVLLLRVRHFANDFRRTTRQDFYALVDARKKCFAQLPIRTRLETVTFGSLSWISPSSGSMEKQLLDFALATASGR